MALRGWMIVVLPLGCGPVSSPDPDDTNAGTDTLASATDPSDTNASVTNGSGNGPGTSPSETTVDVSAGVESSVDEDDSDSFGEDQCDPLNDCGMGYVCCGGIPDPYECREVPKGRCGGSVGCEPGFECDAGYTHCPIGDCVPIEGTSSGSSSTGGGSSSSDGSSSTGS